MTAIRLIGEHHQAFVEQFKQLNASRHTHNEPDDNIVYLAHNTVTVDEIKALLDKDAGLVLPISAIQSVTYYQQVKQFVDQINAEVKWVNTCASHPHFHAMAEQLEAVDFTDKAINRITVYKNQADKTQTLAQQLLGLYMWLESTMSPVTSIMAVEREKATHRVLVLSIQHEAGTMTNVQLVYTDDTEHVAIEVTGANGMLVQQSDSEQGAVVLSKGNRAVLDSVFSKKEVQNVWQAIHQGVDEKSQEKRIETSLGLVEATEQSLESKRPVSVKGVSQ